MSCFQIGAIVLAAGAATRMGRLKQLLAYAGTTLLGHAIRQAEAAQFSPIVVVTGAEALRVQSAISTFKIEVAFNAAWVTGQGSSITAGIRELRKLAPEIAAAAILLGDQPLVRADHLSAMSAKLHTSDAVAAEYSGTLGPPVIFKRSFFERLESLAPSAGAKAVLGSPGIALARFPLAEAAGDIDAPGDWLRLTRELT